MKPQLASLSIPDPNQTDLSAVQTLLRASDARGWHRIRASHYAVTTQPTFVAAPDQIIAHVHTLVLQVDGVVRLRRRTPCRTVEAISQVGSTCLVPLAADGAWSWTGSAQLLHLYIAPELFSGIADEVGRSDPGQIALSEHFDLRDPVIQQIGQAFMAELYTEQYGEQLYAESLSATLALHVLRNYTNFPIVHLPSPRGLAGGETIDNAMTLSWRASDPDASDKLLFTVQYSPDKGGHWRTMMAGLPNRSGADTVTLALSKLSGLPGSTTGGLIRVAASDGYNTTLKTTSRPSSSTTYGCNQPQPRAGVLASAY